MKNPIRIFASSFGAIVGLAGLEHGIGEMLQGSVAPAGLMFASWPDSEFFRSLAGEPAISIIPNLLVSGILTILFSLAFLVWAVVLIQRRHSGRVILLLSAVMLLVGGGIFPPFLGTLVAALAARVNSPHTWWRAHLSPAARRFLKALWPWSYTVCILSWLALFPGVGLLAYFLGIDSEALILAILALALTTMLLTTICGFAACAERCELNAKSQMASVC